MKCEDYLEMLDNTEPGRRPPGAFLEHAEGCERCAFALRLANMLESAPEWGEEKRMSLDKRLELVSRAHARMRFRKTLANYLTDALVTAFLLCIGVFTVVLGLPSFIKNVLPASTSETVLSGLNSITQPLADFWSPLLGHMSGPKSYVLWGILLLFIFFTASLGGNYLTADRTA